ncbi:MAG: hypothetical protein II914_06535 [Clostridia bacterium]|nr:hypothetical protein [Clostridia bacterium]
MSRKKEIRLLCAEADREALKPIVEQLNAKGFTVSDAKDAKKDDIVLTALSVAFYADAEKTESLFGLIGKGAENVLPLQLDGTQIPDTVKNALYARNIIPAAGRDAAQIAERIAGAVPSAPSVLPKILIAGAAVLAVVAGIVIWRVTQNKKIPPAEPPAVVQEEKEDIYIPKGWTEEELKKVADVIIVGDQVELYLPADLEKNNGLYPEFDYFAYRDYYDHEGHWFSREDGHEYAMTRYEDLRFLELLPNLRFLTLAKIETGLLPDLKKLPRLEKLCLMDCELPDLDWVGGSGITNIDLLNTTGSVRDFSPLTSCVILTNVHLDINGMRTGDFSGFAPPAMSWLWINGGMDLESAPDLSGLKACTKLRECQLEFVPVEDLDFLSNATSMDILRLTNLDRLQDISAVRGMKRLRELQIQEANRVRDFSPVAECKTLQIFRVSCDRGQSPLRDASFLGDLPNLNEISIGGVELRDLDFLTTLSSHKNSLNEFSFWGEIGNLEGLSAIKRYNRLNLDPDNSPDFGTVMSYLDGAEIGELALRRFSNVDLSLVPMPSSKLELDRCNLTDLSSMPENFRPTLLNLNKCQNLQSLNGLQNQPRIQNIEIYNCPRLTDWSALEGKDLNRLCITGGYTLPKDIPFHATIYRIESVADVTDLSFLDALDTDRNWCFELVGLDVDNLQPLSRFHGGYITVPPELAEQAEDLVKSRNFTEYKIEYPERGWEEDDSELTLQSLDELNTLPQAMLRHVTSVSLAGDQIFDQDRFDIWQHFRNNKPIAVLHDRQNDTETNISEGSFRDLTPFYQMTGLRRLQVVEQPVTGLDGIQALSELEEISLRCCRKLSDISPLFAMQNLRWIRLEGCPQVTSIQGIQNLPRLTELNINRTGVSDISPLASCDFSEAEEEGGFHLIMDDNPVKDFTALGSVPHFAQLILNNMDCDLWMPCLRDVRIDEFESCGCGFTAESLSRFVSEHPELRRLDIPWNDKLTDLMPLLTLENLETVWVSDNMKQAIASLDGVDYGFELQIED